jgi:coenzyme F420 hydrogenase subunit beta
MQYHDYGALKYGLPVKFAIGLFCSRTFYYSSLFKNFLVSKGIDINKVTKTEITGGKFIVKSGDETMLSTSLKEIDGYGRKSCEYCGDFTAELADISVGSLDSPDGWTTVIVRSSVGEKLFKECVEKGLLECKEMKIEDLKLTIKIAGNKKKKVTQLAEGSSAS